MWCFDEFCVLTWTISNLGELERVFIELWCLLMPFTVWWRKWLSTWLTCWRTVEIKSRRTSWQMEVRITGIHGMKWDLTLLLVLLNLFLFSMLCFSRSGHLRHKIPVGHGQVPYQTILEEHFWDCIQGKWSDPMISMWIMGLKSTMTLRLPLIAYSEIKISATLHYNIA